MTQRLRGLSGSPVSTRAGSSPVSPTIPAGPICRENEGKSVPQESERAFSCSVWRDSVEDSSEQDATREVVGVVQRQHHVAACVDRDSLWVQIAGPKGGRPWNMAHAIARGLATLLIEAADKAEALGEREAAPIHTTETEDR